MIDDKKIEDAAKSLRKDFNDDVTQGFLVEFGFEKGAKWAIDEFLKDLWHPISEEPMENSDIIFVDSKCDVWVLYTYDPDDFDSTPGKGWKSACQTHDIYKWVYKDELLPTPQKQEGV